MPPKKIKPPEPFTVKDILYLIFRPLIVGGGVIGALLLMRLSFFNVVEIAAIIDANPELHVPINYFMNRVVMPIAFGVSAWFIGMVAILFVPISK